MSLWAILPCRSQSERLYCKPLQRIGDRTILDHLIDNIQRLGLIDGVVLAVAQGRANHGFLEFAERRGVPAVVGPEANVLARVLLAVKQFDVQTMFRMTTECPFLYAEGASEVIARHLREHDDFTTILKLPLGTAYELIQTPLLLEMASTGDIRYQAPLSRYIYERQDLFRIRTVLPTPDCRRPELGFAVDHPEQLVFCRRAYRALGGDGKPIRIADLIRFYDENPLLASLLDAVHEDAYAIRSDQTMARVWP